MIPILFEPTATDFSTRGLGPLSDCVSCTVTEERNGTYELEMEYPMSGLHYDLIENRSIILAIPSPYRTAQPFRVYKIIKSISGAVTICAQHISYDLAGIPVKPFGASSLMLALSGIETNSAADNLFSFQADFSSTASFSQTVPTAARSMLGGVDGSILDTYGGEYEFDGFEVKLHKARGSNNGVTIRYGKNLTDLTWDSDVADLVTGIYPYWQDEENNTLVTCSPAIVSCSGTYDFTRVIPVDFTSDFSEQPSAADLQTRAEQYIKDNSLGIPTVSATVSFVQLEQTSLFEERKMLEKCDLCDTVTVKYPDLGVDSTAEIVSIKTDVLLEKYESMTIGTIAPNIAQTISTQGKEIADNEENFPSEWRREMYALAKKITGQTDSHVIFSPMENPSAIIIAENTDLTKSGVGALYLCSGGILGTTDIAAALQDASLWKTAIDINGYIQAEMIRALTIYGEQIIGGIIRNEDGTVYLNLDTGDAHVPRLLGNVDSGGSTDGDWYGLEQGKFTWSGASYKGIQLFYQSYYNSEAKKPYFTFFQKYGNEWDMLFGDPDDGAYPVIRLRNSPATSGANSYVVAVGDGVSWVFGVGKDGDVSMGKLLSVGAATLEFDSTDGLLINCTSSGGHVTFGDNVYLKKPLYFAGGSNIENCGDINLADGHYLTGAGARLADGLSAFTMVKWSEDSAASTVLSWNYGNKLRFCSCAADSDGTRNFTCYFYMTGDGFYMQNHPIYDSSFAASSDRRIKDDITDSDESATEIIKRIRSRKFSYNSKAGEGLAGAKVRFGQIAQEMEPVYPEAVLYNDKDDRYYIDKIKLVDLLLKGLQEANARIDALESEIKALKGVKNGN